MSGSVKYSSLEQGRKFHLIGEPGHIYVKIAPVGTQIGAVSLKDGGVISGAQPSLEVMPIWNGWWDKIKYGCRYGRLLSSRTPMLANVRAGKKFVFIFGFPAGLDRETRYLKVSSQANGVSAVRLSDGEPLFLSPYEEQTAQAFLLEGTAGDSVKAWFCRLLFGSSR